MKEFKVIHKRSVVVTDGQPKLPTSAQTEYGEININYADGYETLSIRNNADEIVPFSNDNIIKGWIDETEFVTSEALNELNGRIITLSSTTNTLSAMTENYAIKSELPDIISTVPDFSAVTESGSVVDALVLRTVIRDNELVTSEALNNLNNRTVELSATTTNLDGRVTLLENTNPDIFASAITINGVTHAVSNNGADLGDGYLTSANTYVSAVTMNGSAKTITDNGVDLGDVVTGIIINESAKTIVDGVIDLGNYIPMEKEYTIAASLNELNDRVIELSGSTQILDNLVTVITSASTHEQYPSAKLVYDTFNEYVTIDDFEEKLGYQLTGENSGRTVSQLTDSIIDYINTNYNKKPVTIYETDGTTGFLGLNASTMDETTWQITGLTLSDYSYIRCYFKQSDLAIANNNDLAASTVVDVPLSDATKSKGSGVCTLFLGASTTLLPDNRNRFYNVVVAVDSTKTKFKVAYQTYLYASLGTVTDANTDGKYLWKIEGYY